VLFSVVAAEKKKRRRIRRRRNWGGNKRGCLSGYNLNISERFTDKY